MEYVVILFKKMNQAILISKKLVLAECTDSVLTKSREGSLYFQVICTVILQLRVESPLFGKNGKEPVVSLRSHMSCRVKNHSPDPSPSLFR